MDTVTIALLDDDLLTLKIWERVCLTFPNIEIDCFGRTETEVLSFVQTVIKYQYDVCIVDINLDSVLSEERRGYVTGMGITLSLIKLGYKGKIVIRTADCNDEIFDMYKTCPFVHKVMRKGTSIKKFLNEFLDEF